MRHHSFNAQGNQRIFSWLWTGQVHKVLSAASKAGLPKPPFYNSLSTHCLTDLWMVKFSLLKSKEAGHKRRKFQNTLP
ncbi:hypothetical protein SRHO_G00337710 [Serrasalmus rhombeus]